MAKRRGPNPFREAIPFIYIPGQIPSTKFIYVCGAVTHVARANLASRNKVDVALKHVRNCLKYGPISFGSVLGWLRYMQIPEDQLSTLAVQEYRIRWLNHLADQWDRGEICK